MQSIRRTVLILTAALLAVGAGSGTALAGPAPLIEPEHADRTSGGTVGTSSSDGFLESWPQVTLAVLLVVVVVAIAAFGISRIHHHAPTAA